MFDLMSPAEQLRVKAAAAGLPVPPRQPPTPAAATTVATESAQQATINLSITADLLKPFTSTDPPKQSRFEAFQVLTRRGFDGKHSVAFSWGRADDS